MPSGACGRGEVQHVPEAAPGRELDRLDAAADESPEKVAGSPSCPGSMRVHVPRPSRVMPVTVGLPA